MTIEERAREMLNEIAVKRNTSHRWGIGYTRSNSVPMEALCREIEAHDAKDAELEAFRRDVSDEIERCILSDFAKDRLSRFILPKPVDPLVAVMAFNSLDTATAEQRAANLREDAKALGYEIKLVEAGDAD